MNKYKLLDDRENRNKFQYFICRKYGLPVAVIRANIPGENKVYPESLWIVYKIFLECKKRFSLHKVFHRFSSEGLIFFLVLNCSGEEAKRIAVEIEETHRLGRLSDIDIMEKNKTFSRGNNFRKCFLCEAPAIICSRIKAHSLEETTAFIKNTVHADWKGDIHRTLAYLSEASMLSELCRGYGFGCVTANGSGSHNDMDFLLMLKCLPFISGILSSLNESLCSDFSLLRVYGKQAERKMMELTGGINTYKGALFLLLILNACCYRVIKKKKSFKDLHEETALFSKPLTADFENGLFSAASAKLFKEKNTAGVRSLALNGFSEHFNMWLPLLKKGGNINLLFAKIAAETWDSTIIKRKGSETLDLFKNLAANTVCEKDLKALNSFCRKKNISAGGTADKIIILWNLYLIEEILF